MSNNVTLKITFTPQESSAATAQMVRDWVAREAASLSPVDVVHAVEDGETVQATYDITAVELADE